MTRRRVLAVTTSPLPHGEQITDGPGYRMWNLLEVLVRKHDVHVLSLYESFHLNERRTGSIEVDGLTVESPSHRPSEVQRQIREIGPDALYLPWSSVPFLGRANRRIPTILDFVGPGLYEDFVANGRISAPLLDLALESFWYGDLFMTTTRRERFYLLGLLAASRRLTEGRWERDDSLVQVVRMTPPPDPPQAATHRPERRGSERIFLLAGAFLPWYDYGLLARAINLLDQSTKALTRVVVMGGNPRMPWEEKRVRDTLSQGIHDGCVEFSGIVPFSRRAEYYLGADVGLVISPNTVEDELSARTRIVDYLWARLPVSTPWRDEYSEELLAEGAGFAYGPRPEDLAKSISRVVEETVDVDKARLAAGQLLAEGYDPTVAARPFFEFLEEPRLTERRPHGSPAPKIVAMWLRDLAKGIRSGRL